jgi:hypothetical protein
MKRFSICILTLYLLLITNHSFAQVQNSKISYWWINVGGGPVLSDLRDEPGLFGANFSYQAKNYIFSGRINYQSDFAMFTSPTISITEGGILYGICKKSKFWLSSVAGGLGFISGVRHNRRVSALGIPIEGQLFVTPLPFMGIGLYGITDLNTKVTFYSIMLCLQFGKLR